MRMRALVAVLVVSLFVLPAVRAGEISVPIETGGSVSVRIVSLYENRFRTTLKQQYDYSCGSAALATLLTYHFRDPVSEQEAFQAMYEAGDQEKIRREGFSLLDMKRYLEAKGYLADGYRLPLAQLAKFGVPAISLVSEKGYRHFVVIKGIRGDRVLLGDPARGTRALTTQQFEAIHTGIYFLIRNRKDIAQANFNQVRDWPEPAPLGHAVSREALGSMLLLLPNRYDF